jgi:poly(A) polymerase
LAFSAQAYILAAMDDSARPFCSRDDALAVLRRLREAGHVACFAGGCVRDLLMGLEPKDYDVATDAPPRRVRELFPNTQAVGAAFGVILVRHGRSVVEVATFRAEGRYEDGRRPSEVRFTTAEEDAKRRDFTINGLFLDPLDHDRVIDYVGGQEDLKNRILRAIGDPDVRFAEDYLRLLRAVRFASRFDLTIEPGTAEAIRKRAALLTGISPERVGDELRRMLTPPTRTVAWRLLREFRLLEILFRFIRETAAPPASHADTPETFEQTAPGESIQFVLALAAGSLSYLWPRIGVADVRELTTRAWRLRIVDALRKSLKISNDESDELEGTLGGVEILLRDEPPAGVATLKRFLARPTAGLARKLVAALARAGFHAQRAGHVEAELRELERTEFAPLPLITGDDLTAAGMTPGPRFKKVLNRVYDAQLEGEVRTKEEAMALARQLHNGG